MHELLQFLGEHWFLAIVIVAIVVGGISDVVDGRTKLANDLGELDALQAQLAAKGGAQSSAADVHTVARMARLLDKVQEADTVIPQLSRDLRLLIDVELENYHMPPVIESSKKEKRS